MPNIPEGSAMFDELIRKAVADPAGRLGDILADSIVARLTQSYGDYMDRTFVVPVRRPDGIEVLTGPPMSRERKAKQVNRGV